MTYSMCVLLCRVFNKKQLYKGIHWKIYCEILNNTFPYGNTSVYIFQDTAMYVWTMYGFKNAQLIYLS